MQSIEVLRVIKKIGIKPKRTIRAVLFINEENGLRGGEAYAELDAPFLNGESEKVSPENSGGESEKKTHRAGVKHILAIESDAGGFTPRGFTMSMPPEKKEKILKWKDYFLPYGVYDFSRKGGGADISPLGKKGVPLMGLSPDNQRYFIIHHTANDVFEQVNKRELELGAIVMTIMVYLVSEYGL
jgi:Zn-dependent M28 family amino/carboxypeptidase